MIGFHKWLETVRHIRYVKFMGMKQAERSRIYSAYQDYVQQLERRKTPSRRKLKTR